MNVTRYRDKVTGRFVARKTWERSRVQLRARAKRLGVRYIASRFQSVKIDSPRDTAGRFIVRIDKPAGPVGPPVEAERVNWIDLWNRWSAALGEKPIEVKTPYLSAKSKPADNLLEQSGTRLELRQSINEDPRHKGKSWQIAAMFDVWDDAAGLHIYMGQGHTETIDGRPVFFDEYANDPELYNPEDE